MKKVALVGVAMACCAAVTASDFNSLSASCIGLDKQGTQRCMDIIARHKFAPLPTMRPFTLAEKTAVEAILAGDPQAVIVVLPDGSFDIGQPVVDRVIGIPCKANPCPTH